LYHRYRAKHINAKDFNAFDRMPANLFPSNNGSRVAAAAAA